MTTEEIFKKFYTIQGGLNVCMGYVRLLHEHGHYDKVREVIKGVEKNTYTFQSFISQLCTNESEMRYDESNRYIGSNYTYYYDGIEVYSSFSWAWSSD